MKYTINQAIESYNKGEEIEYLFFWGHQPKKDGSISKSCFSQWWPATFSKDEIEYKSAEHFMMAEKAILFGDEEIRKQIINCESPKKAKSLGRKVKNFDHSKWEENKYQIVKIANELKFTQNEALKTFLIQTENKTIVEASPVDPIWGIGLAEDNPDINNPNLWKGENLLGFILMEIRDTIVIK